MSRIGGSYKVIDGVAVLVNRTGWTPPKKESVKADKKRKRGGDESAAGSQTTNDKG